eukprot:CAMPEP_0183346270 /NCGR_PEP_ID=MMETSP0164_2-20130417/11439_1 /TAXON_ID=221442 /ORGANISM="Coccolithus pelagicus ssp braarudi, Strain PLY182g" /LENGTH=190 /DNA_ID=CAMNT_0025517519 /DNA_START=260 /DNA_END=831 /DNA_ORIENTATION=+
MNIGKSRQTQIAVSPKCSSPPDSTTAMCEGYVDTLGWLGQYETGGVSSSSMLRGRIVGDGGLEAVLHRLELALQLVDRIVNRLCWPGVRRACLDLDLDCRLERVRHTVSREDHLIVLEQLHAQKVANRVVLSFDHHHHRVRHLRILLDDHLLHAIIIRKPPGVKVIRLVHWPGGEWSGEFPLLVTHNKGR